MQLLNIFPDKEQINELFNIESALLTRKKTGKIAGRVAMFSALVQLMILIYPYLIRIADSSNELHLSEYLSDPWKLIPLIILIFGGLTYLVLRRTSFLIKETKEPFRYTCWVDSFQRIDETPGDRFKLKADDRFALLHHDLTELINQRIKRFSILETSPDQDDNSGAVTDIRKSSHIHIYGYYAIREDKNNGEWIIHVMPYVRIGPKGSPSTMAQTIRYPISTDDTPDELDTHEYNQLLERVYSRVTTEIYARIEKDIQTKIELFPTAYLQANALYHEARDMANSNTINAYESAISLYEEAIRKINLTLVKKLSHQFIGFGFFRIFLVQSIFQNAVIQIGHAKCLVYKNRIAGLSGKKRNPVFGIRQDLKAVIRDLEFLHYKTAGNSAIINFKKENEKAFSVLAYLSFPNDSWWRRLLGKPSKHHFDEIRTILFNAYVVHSLTDSLLFAYLSAQEFLDKAKAVAPDLSAKDPLYFLAQAYIEPNIDKALLLFQRATEMDPTFQIAQYDMAFWTEMKFRKDDEITPSRAKIALDEYEKVLRINPGNIAALAAQGYIYWLLNDADKARRKFEEGCELKTMVSETFIGQLLYGRARILVEHGRINESYDLFNQAYASNPNVGAFTISDNSWFHYSFYDYISHGLWSRFREYANRFVTFSEKNIFELQALSSQLKDTLDKEELSAELYGLLRKRGIWVEEGKTEITVVDKSKRWQIRHKAQKFNPVELEASNGEIRVWFDPEVSPKIKDSVFSYILNDFGNASFNFYKRFGKREYLNDANQSYSDAMKYTPHFTIAKYNSALALYEYEKYSESINLLNEVIRDNPRWFEASASSIEITQPKVDEEIRLKEAELAQIKSKILALQSSKAENQFRQTSMSNVAMQSSNLTGLTEDLRDINVKPISIQSEIEEHTISKERLEKTIESLKISKENLRKTIRNIFLPTKLIALFDGMKLEGFNDRKIEVFLDSDLKWVRMDEDDVRVLRIYAISYYFHLLSQNENNTNWTTCIRLFNHLLTYYYPEDYNINFYKKGLILSAGGTKEEAEMCSRIIESCCISWIEQDPVHFKNIEYSKSNISDEKYFDYLENAYEMTGSPEVLNLLINLEYLKVKKISRLVELIESNPALDNESREVSDIYFRLGNLFASEKQDEEAVKYFKKAVKFNGDQINYHRSLGLSYYNLQRWEGLIESFVRAIELSKHSPAENDGLDYYYDYLSEAFYLSGRLPEFLDLFEKSGDLDDRPDKKAIIYNRIGNLKYGRQETEDAISFYDKALTLDPGRPIYYNNKGLMFATLSRWEEAKACYTQALELRKNNPNDYYGLDYYYDFLSEAYYHTGQIKEFLELFEASGDLENEPDKKAFIYNRIGNLFVNTNREKEALAFYEKAISIDPSKPIYTFNLGYTYSKLESWSEAITFYLKAIELRRKAVTDSYDFDYYYEFLSEAYFRTGRTDEFIQLLEASGDLNSSPQKKAVIYNRVGNLYSNDQQYTLAIPFYSKAMELDPERPIYCSNRGLMYTLLKEWKEAGDDHQRAFDLRMNTPDDPFPVSHYTDLLNEVKISLDNP